MQQIHEQWEMERAAALPGRHSGYTAPCAGRTLCAAPAKLLSQGCPHCWPRAAHTASAGLSELVSRSVSQWPWGCTRSTACHQPSLTPTCFWIKIHPSLSFYLRTLAAYLTKKASMFHYFFPFFSSYGGVDLFLCSLRYWMTATVLTASPITWNVFILLFWKMKREYSVSSA